MNSGRSKRWLEDWHDAIVRECGTDDIALLKPAMDRFWKRSRVQFKLRWLLCGYRPKPILFTALVALVTQVLLFRIPEWRHWLLGLDK